MTKTKENGKLVGFRKRVASGFPTHGLFVIVGNVKTGKSSLLPQFPDSYCLSCEKEGMDHLEGRIHDVETLGEFREIIVPVLRDPDIKTVCIDTIDAVAEWIAQDVAESFGLKHINEVKKGVNGWDVSGEFAHRMQKMIDLLRNSGKLVVMTAHYKPAQVDSAGVTVDGAKIAVRGKSADYIAYHAKMIGWTLREDDGDRTRYFLSFKGNAMQNGGSRVEEVQDKIIELPKGKGYEAFAGLFEETKTKKGGK